MRPLYTKGLLLIALLGAVSGRLRADEHSEENESSKSVIIVEYREDEFYPERTRYNQIGELDRFHYLKRNFERVFAKEDWGVEFEYKLYPVKESEGKEILEIAMLTFNSRNPIEVELRTWAKFRGKGANEDFGVQSVRHAPSPFTTQGSIERDLDSIYSGLAKQIAKKLNQTIFSNK